MSEGEGVDEEGVPVWVMVRQRVSFGFDLRLIRASTANVAGGNCRGSICPRSTFHEIPIHGL
jgi:hypothetical protein